MKPPIFECLSAANAPWGRCWRWSLQWHLDYCWLQRSIAQSMYRLSNTLRRADRVIYRLAKGCVSMRGVCSFQGLIHFSSSCFFCMATVSKAHIDTRDALRRVWTPLFARKIRDLPRIRVRYRERRVINQKLRSLNLSSRPPGSLEGSVKDRPEH